MPNFLLSTHKKNWILSKEQLESLYQEKHSSLVSQLTSKGVPNEILNFLLTREEEETLLLGLCRNLLMCCKHINLHLKAQTTAISYFRRFFLRNPVCLNDPGNLMFTALYVACKTEEINVRDASSFCSNFQGSNPQKILQSEIVLISGINFQLYVYTPYKPLKALIEFLKNKGFGDADLDEIEKKAKEFIEIAHFGDTFFTYSPAALAIAGIYAAIFERMDRDDLIDEIAAMGNNSGNVRQAISDITREVESITQKLKMIDNAFKGLLKKAGAIKHKIGKILSMSAKPKENA
ncbi:unnamed protein product [Blepharisma stoltei]|uniref:Cyclin-like domain-containing protein n=1 Tax=Blepharisma stoltei TaxID=1481888 RepID=A0AAU9IXX8_9CILI|nr:unnamed protein product [Blepharisma stoltei]